MVQTRRVRCGTFLHGCRPILAGSCYRMTWSPRSRSFSRNMAVSLTRRPLGMTNGWRRPIPITNTLGPKNAFWVAIRVDKGEVVSCLAACIWPKTRLVDMINARRFLYDGTKDQGKEGPHLFTEGLGHIDGNIAFCGGGWVHPKVRGLAASTMVRIPDFPADKVLLDHIVGTNVATRSPTSGLGSFPTLCVLPSP